MITHVRKKDYPLEQHVTHLQEEKRQSERDMWAKARAKKARAHTMEWTRAQVRTRDRDAEQAAESEDAYPDLKESEDILGLQVSGDRLARLKEIHT